jgi:hypothetical protein
MSDQQSSERSIAAVKPIGLTIAEVMQADKCARATVYERIWSGQYEAFKDGAKTFVTIESFERRRANLPSWSDGSDHKRPPPRRKRHTSASARTAPRRRKAAIAERVT